MGAPETGLEATGHSSAGTLLTALRTIKDAERARHAGVLEYWLSIRGDKEFPPLHDLDPLEISDAGPSSILFELIGGGQDAEIRHLGDALADQVTVDRLIDAPNPSLLCSIARKLPIVAISRDFLAFEENFSTATGLTRCWVTLLPLSSCGSWVDYVYAFVSLEVSGTRAVVGQQDPAAGEPEVEGEAAGRGQSAATHSHAEEKAKDAPAADPVVDLEKSDADEADAPVGEIVSEGKERGSVAKAEPSDVEAMPEEAGVSWPATETDDRRGDEPANPPQEAKEAAPHAEDVLDPCLHASPEAPASVEPAESKTGPGFSRLIEGIANLAGFYGQGIKAEDEVKIVHPGIEVGESTLAGTAPEDRHVGKAKPEAPRDMPIEPEAHEPPPPEGGDRVEDAVEPGAVRSDHIGDGADVEPAEPVAAEPGPQKQPQPAMEGSLQDKLSDVRAKADEAREAQLRATKTLHEGLSAAYDFALDAETSPEEYLRLVEAQGMKIQLRAPMAPVASLAFDGLCDAGTIKQFEAVLAWALKEELPRGALIERIEQAGGIPELLNGA